MHEARNNFAQGHKQPSYIILVVLSPALGHALRNIIENKMDENQRLDTAVLCHKRTKTFAVGALGPYSTIGGAHIGKSETFAFG